MQSTHLARIACARVSLFVSFNFPCFRAGAGLARAGLCERGVIWEFMYCGWPVSDEQSACSWPDLGQPKGILSGS